MMITEWLQTVPISTKSDLTMVIKFGNFQILQLRKLFLMVTDRAVVSQQLELLALVVKLTPVLGGHQVLMQLSLAEVMPQINTLWEITVPTADFG